MKAYCTFVTVSVKFLLLSIIFTGLKNFLICIRERYEKNYFAKIKFCTFKTKLSSDKMSISPILYVFNRTDLNSFCDFSIVVLEILNFLVKLFEKLKILNLITLW